ncbi:hypothetical protein [Flavobacterium columnare]|uniref:hypothetical protein n=1 Tax=Flavobacterium columnare TaxID=996 RepID=UPI00030AEC03|nr:hypothetical protein [Flavobacterium columnare]
MSAFSFLELKEVSFLQDEAIAEDIYNDIENKLSVEAIQFLDILQKEKRENYIGRKNR